MSLFPSTAQVGSHFCHIFTFHHLGRIFSKFKADNLTSIPCQQYKYLWKYVLFKWCIAKNVLMMYDIPEIQFFNHYRLSRWRDAGTFRKSSWSGLSVFFCPNFVVLCNCFAVRHQWWLTIGLFCFFTQPNSHSLGCIRKYLVRKTKTTLQQQQKNFVFEGLNGARPQWAQFPYQSLWALTIHLTLIRYVDMIMANIFVLMSHDKWGARGKTHKNC